MSKPIHKPGTPLKTARVGRVKKSKIAKAHKKNHGKSQGKDWFGAAPGIKAAEHM